MYASLQSVPWGQLLGVEDGPHYPPPLFKIQLTHPDLDLSVTHWNSTLEVGPIRIRSRVVKGYGRGGRQLGMPTGMQ